MARAHAAWQFFIIALVLLDLTILIVYTFVNPDDESETSFTDSSAVQSSQVWASRSSARNGCIAW